MHRGIRRTDIYSNDADREVFLALLQKALNRHDCKLHAFCMMSNHFHLLLQTGQVELWKTMKDFSHDYAMYYNHTHGYTGHLFENRYKAIIVKDDHYFLESSRYIHLNPVKAHMVVRPEDYKWSSYRTILGLSKDPITEREKTLLYFKGNPSRYRTFVEDVGHKYAVSEEEIHRLVEDEELWLPW